MKKSRQSMEAKKKGVHRVAARDGLPPPLPSPMTPNEPGLTHKGTQHSASAFGQAKVLECE